MSKEINLKEVIEIRVIAICCTGPSLTPDIKLRIKSFPLRQSGDCLKAQRHKGPNNLLTWSSKCGVT